MGCELISKASLDYDAKATQQATNSRYGILSRAEEAPWLIEPLAFSSCFYRTQLQRRTAVEAPNHGHSEFLHTHGKQFGKLTADRYY